MHITVGITPNAQKYRCLLDGVDISDDCFEADSEEGWALCYERDASGMHYQRDGIAVVAKREGTVVLTGPS